MRRARSRLPIPSRRCPVVPPIEVPLSEADVQHERSRFGFLSRTGFVEKNREIRNQFVI